jgi:hypothetical protein
MRAKDFVIRWQELVGWLPLTIVAVLAAWLVLGALLPWGAETALEAVIDLAIRLAYALAAAGVARLLWRRWRMPLSDRQQRDYWTALMRGESGAILAYVGNAIVYIGLVAMLLVFFWVPR